MFQRLDIGSKCVLFWGLSRVDHLGGRMSERLKKYEFFKHCLRLKTQGFTGTVLLEREEGNTAIRFEDGVPFHASSDDVTLSFAGLLIRRSLLDPSSLKRLLEESLEQHVKLETLLVDQGRLTSKEVLKTKRELSSQVFLHAFCVDEIPIRQIPGETTDEEALAARTELEPYETLFRAVLGDPDRNVFLRLFRDRWDEVLEKTADFYRHMLRFRSVAYGEDVVGFLMEGEPTARRVLGLVSDKDAALAKLFALTYSGMLMFHGSPKGEAIPRPFSSEPFQPNEPIKSNPAASQRNQPPVTTELHALARAASRRGPREEFDAAYGRASVQEKKVAVTEDRLSVEAVREEIIRQAENLGVSKEDILEALGPGRGADAEALHREEPMAPPPGQETLVGLVDALREQGVPLEVSVQGEAEHRAIPVTSESLESAAQAAPAEEAAPAEAVAEVVQEAIEAEESRELSQAEEALAEALVEPASPAVEPEQPHMPQVSIQGDVILSASDESEPTPDPESVRSVLAGLEESKPEIEAVPEPVVAAPAAPAAPAADVQALAEWVVPLEEVNSVATAGPAVQPAQPAPAFAAADSFAEGWPQGLYQQPAAGDSYAAPGQPVAPSAPWTNNSQPQQVQQQQAAPVAAPVAPAPVEAAPDINTMIDRAMAQAAMAVTSSSMSAVVLPTAPAVEEPLALDLEHATGEGLEKSGEGEEEDAALALLMGGLPPVPAKPEAPELGTDESIERILEDVYRSMQQRNLYELLNVTQLSPLSAIRDATQRLRNKYAPTQYRGFLMSKRAHRLLKLVREAVDRAEQVLTHFKSRRHYDEMLSTPYPMERQVWLHQMFHAERDFQAGLKLITAKELTRAVDMLGRAVTSNANDPDYVAWRGYALYQRHKSGRFEDPTAVSRVRADFEKALTLDPRHARALLFMARLEDELDNLEGAMNWYARLQKVEPGNEEAAEALERLRRTVAERRSGDPGGWMKFKGMFNKKK